MRRATAVTIVASVVLHGAIAAIALSAAHDKKVRRATTVALADQEKKTPKPKPEEPKPPPPPPPKIVAPPKVAPAKVAAPTPSAEPPPTSAPASAPVASDISMSNEVGMDMGTGVKTPGTELPKPGVKAPAAKPGVATPSKTPLEVHAPPPSATDVGGCSEPAGKPEPSLKTDIEYTEEARAAGIEGRLVLEATVDADGNVTAVKVIASVDPSLDATAIATVKTWRFKPALACGKPVAGGTYRIARRFVLGD